jgi:hypothetical protein
MAWIEDVVKRGRSAKHFHDEADPAKKQAILTIHDQHYHDGSAWQDCDENIAADASETGYVASLTKMRHIMRFANTGGRKWWPRREFPNEYVTFGRPQYFSGTWKNMSTGTMVRSGQVVTFTTTDYVIRLTATWRGVKLDYILNNTNAYKRVRTSVALTGLTWDGWNLIGVDGKVAGLISGTTASDANGAVVPVTDANTGGYIEFTVDTTGAVYPVTVDPSPLTQVSDTADGRVYGSSTVYATSRSTSAGFFSTTSTLHVGQHYYFDGEVDYWYDINRSFLKFDTSSLPNDCTITQVNLKLTLSSDFSSTDFDVQIVKQDWSGQDPLAAGTSEAAYDGCLAGTADDAIWRNTSGVVFNTEYTSGNLAIAWPSKTGATYYSLRSSRDFGNNAPTSEEYISVYSANDATAGYRPSLVVAYNEAGGGATSRVQLHALRCLWCNMDVIGRRI